ncbi:MAG: Trp biosynthesis-associated membrane protein [Pontimonas sp.]
MTDPSTARRGSRHYPMIVALIAGLVGVGAPWVVVELPTGAVGQAGVSEIAPVSFSAALAAVAAWGATLLTRSMVTRVVSGLQAVLGVISGVFFGRAFIDTDSVIESVAAAASGVVGALSAADAVSTWSPVWIGLWAVVLAAVIASGVWGVLAPGSRGATRSKYERSNQIEDGDLWESLSDGVDPTSR